MRSNDRRTQDFIGETVARDSAGNDLLLSVLANIDNRRERALLFASVALDLPPSALARTFGMDRLDMEKAISDLLDRLRSDKALMSRLKDIHRAGRPENYLALAERLDLQDWFCVSCNRFMVQPAVGRPRTTCSSTCRSAVRRRLERNIRNGTMPNQVTYRSIRRQGDESRLSRLNPTPDEQEAMNHALHKMVRTINTTYSARMMSAEARDRNLALILLGFTCPVQLNAQQLATLTMEDIVETTNGLELRLHWGKQRVRQYAKVTKNIDHAICAVHAAQTWRQHLRTSGRHSGPFFVWLRQFDKPSIEQPELSAQLIVKLTRKTLSGAGLRPTNLSESDFLPTYLKDLVSRLPDYRS